MSVFEHSHRARIYNPSQHPYKHSVSEFGFVHPALPGVSNLEDALNYIFTVLYPNSQDAVDEVADLPAVGNTIGDFRVVLDDGDGKAAGYQWQQREGDASASWYKIYDMDWGADGILAGFLLKTQDLYVYRYGYDDLDDDGVAVTGTLAGQRIFGGASASTNLTLSANSGDGTGAQTGYVQVTDHFRPTSDNALDVGTSALKFRTGYYGTSVLAGTMTVAGGSLTDSSGAISFADENLSTTGTLASGTHTVGNMVIASASITNTSGAISFADENLSTTGTLASGTHTIGTLVLAAASITDTGGAISFGDENLSTTGTLAAGTTTVGQLNVDNLRLDGSTLSITAADTTLVIAANGTGVVNVTSAMTTIDQTVTGTLAVTGQLNADNLRLDGNTISSTNADGSILLDPNGTGAILVAATVFGDTDNAYDLGDGTHRFRKLFLSNAVSDGTNEIAIATLLSLRDILSGAGSGMAIFYDGAKFVTSIPDTEVEHGTISGLGDDDHTQYVLLAGRGTGQTINGGLASGNDLTLHSTADATKGSVLIAGKLSPLSTATYDFGATAATWNDAYITGQLIGARVENYTTAGRPAASGGTAGRLYYDTTTEDLYFNRAGTWTKASIEKYVNQDSTTWNGTAFTQTYTTSAEITDARLAVWAFKNNTNNFEQEAAKITMSQTQVTVTFPSDMPPTAGTYTLVGIG